MKRKVVVVFILLIANILLIKGITYANKIMLDHNFMIYINSKENNNANDNENDNNKNNDNENDNSVNNDYDGVSYTLIGKRLDKYFKNSKMEGKGEYIAKYSITHGVNPYLIGGIIIENTNCDVKCNIRVDKCNNVGDISGDPGCFGGTYAKYDTLEDGIKDLVNYINSNYYSNNIKNPNGIYKKYGKDVAWAYRVNNYMEDLKNN